MVTSPAGDNNTHSLPADEVASILGSDPGKGLSRSEAGDRLDRYGRNILPSAPPPHPFTLLARQFTSLLVIILLLAAALNLILWLLEGARDIPYDTVVIMAIVVANAALGFFQEFRAEKSLEKLKALTSPRATVLRESVRMEIESSELVPGDVLVLDSGDSVLADARLASASSLEVNEGTLTGESAPVIKSSTPVEAEAPLADRTSMVFAGTQVSAGKGLALVCATGAGTEVGKIAELLIGVAPQETPLQKGLEQLGKRLGVAILLVAAVVSASGLLVSGATGENIMDLLLFGVALAVAAIPEGLPAVVTGSLALGTQRMAKRKAIIRRLHAVEVLGSTSAICSDKTGTLTAGEMMVREAAVPSGKVSVAGTGYSPEGGEISGRQAAIDEVSSLAASAALCNDASISRDENGHWRPVGTPTEAALVTLAARLGVDYSFIRSQNRRIAEEPFSSERKRMTVITTAGGGGAMLHTKGAPEVILPLCSRVATADGTMPLTGAQRQKFLDLASQMSAQALRSLAVARRQVEPGDCGLITACEKDLVFLGLTGIADPPRAEAAASISECQNAGIQVFMITGDHLATAKAIAADLGISGEALTGSQIEGISDEDLAGHIKRNTRIFARISPGHKVRIVTALQESGHTVAVTGDGVNDAPALKKADIGVAMGQTGTDVAREAADMVLADDNFATIVAAVEEGRVIFTNIRKFLGFLLSANAGLVLALFLGVIFAQQLGLISEGRLLLPLLAVQILWINLVTNGPPALALGVEPKHPEAMRLPPRPREESVVNREILWYIMLVGIVAGLGGIIILNGYFPGGLITIREHAGIEYPRTMAFVTLTMFMLFASLNFRDLRNSVLNKLLGNPWLLAALALSSAMMVAVVHVPALQPAFQTAPLQFFDWLIAVAVASTVLWAVEIYKLLRKSGGWVDRIMPFR
ncbi:MAG: HAD-IC family P-type ATPase [Thermoleophilia bacterium]|nr:HAD-IC family P-type ATPase [Thermoleophilia bacterium]